MLKSYRAQGKGLNGHHNMFLVSVTADESCRLVVSYALENYLFSSFHLYFWCFFLWYYTRTDILWLPHFSSWTVCPLPWKWNLLMGKFNFKEVARMVCFLAFKMKTSHGQLWLPTVVYYCESIFDTSPWCLVNSKFSKPYMVTSNGKYGFVYVLITLKSLSMRG